MRDSMSDGLALGMFHDQHKQSIESDNLPPELLQVVNRASLLSIEENIPEIQIDQSTIQS
jgi:hypothetical protein